MTETQFRALEKGDPVKHKKEDMRYIFEGYQRGKDNVFFIDHGGQIGSFAEIRF